MPTVPVVSGRSVAPDAARLPHRDVLPQRQQGIGSIGQGLGNLGGVLGELAQQEREKADRSATLDADNQISTWENGALFDAEAGAFTKRGKDAFDLPNQVLPQFDAEADRIEKGLSNDTQRQIFKERRQHRRQQIEQKLNQHEANERERHYDAQDDATLKTSRGTAANYYNDPVRIGEELDKQDAVIDAHGQRKGWSAEEIAEAKRASRSGTHTDVIERHLARGEWRRAQNYFEDLRDQIGGDDATRIESALTAERRRAEAEARARQAEARQALSERVRDAQASYLFGLDYDSPPTRDEFVSAFGADDGNKRFDAFAKTQQLGADLKAMAVMSEAEQNELLAERTPKGTAGAAGDVERYNALAQRTEQLRAARDKDPASYVARYSPRVQTLLEQAQTSPEAARAYATATIAEQRRLGVARPQILPSETASAIAQSFHTGENGEAVAALIQQEQAKWGQHWPQVFGELAAKKIPPAALAIGRGMEPGAATRLASVAAVPIDELKKGLDTPAADIREEITSSMQQFGSTLNGVVGAENTFAGMYDAVERLTYSYLRQGKKLSDAAEQAYTEVIGNNYAFHDVNGRFFRVPLEHDTPGLEVGARRALDAVKASELQAPVPTGTSSSENAAADLERVIRKRGYWVTSASGESGLALFLDGAPVLRKDGSVYEVSFDDLSAQVLTRREQIDRSLEDERARQRDRGY